MAKTKRSAAKVKKGNIFAHSFIEDERIVELEKENAKLRKKLDKANIYQSQLINQLAECRENEKQLIERIQELQKDIKVRTSALKEEIEKVGKLMRAKDEFLRNVSHELKTPLSVILLNIPLAQKMVARGNIKMFSELIDSMSRNAMRLRDSIEDILELSRLGTETVHIKDNVDVKKMVDYAKEVYGPIAERKGIVFETNVEQVSVLGDPKLLPYALSNLVSNAVKFTDKGKISINVRGTPSEVLISVSDTGKGIAKEHQQKMFEKFFKVDQNAPGSGLGLAIVREIIKKHGGRIEVKSKLGQGSTFTIILPKKR